MECACMKELQMCTNYWAYGSNPNEDINVGILLTYLTSNTGIMDGKQWDIATIFKINMYY